MLFTKELIDELANKAFVIDTDKKAAVKELCRRTRIAFYLFISNQCAITLLRENPNLVNEIKGELVQYINRHFNSESNYHIILKSIDNQAEYLASEFICALSRKTMLM